MEHSNIKRIINKANSEQYNNDLEVERYISRPYHALRERIALMELDKRIKQQYPIVTCQMNVLEIAGSTGFTSLKIKALGYDVIVSDNQETPLKVAEMRGLSCIRFDANDDFPFPNNRFHAIMAGEIIEHIFDIEKFLLECNRVLKNNGLLVLTTPNLAALQDRILFLFGINPRQIDPLHHYRKLHIRQFTKYSMTKVLKQTGFSRCRYKSNLVRLEFGKNIVVLNRLLAVLFPSLGGTLIVSAVKELPNKSCNLNQEG